MTKKRSLTALEIFNSQVNATPYNCCQYIAMFTCLFATDVDQGLPLSIPLLFLWFVVLSLHIAFELLAALFE
jgi:hypothetical protein